MPRPPDYGVIYNWDGAPHGYSEYPQSMEAFLEKMYAPLADTQVGAHFWCVGEHTARWKSDVLEMVGDVHGRRYENASSYTLNENIRAMVERGEDPQAEAIKRGHELGMHVYASVRMNDNHFGGAQVRDLLTMRHSDLTRMRIEHPEWVLGDQTSEWFVLSWNFGVPEIREHRFAHIEEICRLYDWDGVELDWQRHPFHLPDDHGYRLRYALTDLQRSLRRMTNELAEKRGRPFYVAARVAGSLEGCRHIGYDVPTWVEEGLADILIPAGNAMTDASIDVAAFRELCRGTGIVIYPGLDGGMPNPRVAPMEQFTIDDPMVRGIASKHYRAGADGIYVFNWHADRELRRELLTTIGSPETLRRKDKVYAATYRVVRKEGEWRGQYRVDRLWGEVPVPLKRTQTSDGPTANLDIADDLATDVPEGIELRVRLDEWVKQDVVRVLWDGVELAEPHITYIHEKTPAISDVTSSVWQSYNLAADQVPVGPHRVKVVLVERNPRLACDIVLTDVELVITYQKD